MLPQFWHNRLILSYGDPEDNESVKLQDMLKNATRFEVLKEVTGLKDEALLQELAQE